MPRDRWNHNIHHHPLVLRAVRPGYRSAIDVGCGEGILARELRAVLPEVTAIDVDGPSVELARRQDPEGRIEHVHADVRTADLGTYDLVASIATVHHMDPTEALTRLRDLVAPGGTLVIVGLARSRLPKDLPIEAAGVVTHCLLRTRHTFWEHSAPTVWPPPETYAGVRRRAQEHLPGVRYRRHVLWRYSLTWRRPPTRTSEP